MRAISVAGVVLFHAQVPGFSGGFVGVDIFFVISGFLITSLLLREVESTGTINAPAFWARRAWRLLPNALLTLVAILAASWFWRSAAETKSTTLDVGAALLYVANYWFAMRAVDYFDNAQQASPVLHFWSLAVEEQFYLVWPLLILLLVWRSSASFRGRALTAAAVICIASFAASIYWINRNQPAAFFHTEARIWQLSSGAVLAALGQRAVVPVALHNVAGWAGLAGLLATIVLLREDSYPGVRALLPVTAAALLIACGGHDGRMGVQRLLALPALQWTGRRSYSIYLWHWPLLLFAPPQIPQYPLISLGILALVLAVAAASFALVEEPLRRQGSNWRLSLRLSIPIMASVCVGFAALGIFHVTQREVSDPSRIDARIAQAATDSPQFGSTAGCLAPFGNDIRAGCRYGIPDAQDVAVLFGDSYAEHLFDGADAAAREAGWSLRLWTRASCPPVDAPSIDSAKRVVDYDCTAWREAAIRKLIAERPNLILISAWAGIANAMTDAQGRKLSREASQAVWREGFARTLQRLRDAGLAVVVIRGTPRGSFEQLQSCLDDLSDACGRPRAQVTAYSAIEQEVVRKVPGVTFVDLSDRFCGPNVCYSIRDGKIVYRDRNHHLTRTFALTLIPTFVRVLQAAR